MEALAIILGVFCALAAAFAILLAVLVIQERLDQRRRRRQGMTEREVAAQMDPGNYGVDISVWPSRAPRNGSSYEGDRA